LDGDQYAEIVLNALYFQSTSEPSGSTADTSNGEQPTLTTQEVTQFLDEEKGDFGGYAAFLKGPVLTDHTAINADIQQFLSRPTLIATQSWTQGNPVAYYETIYPWNLFFSNARVQYKLNNYGFIQCDLHIKILLNSSPFYFGAGKWVYQPLQTFNPGTLPDTVGANSLILWSQRPGVWISPQSNSGGEMILPFFKETNWLTTTSSTDFTNMGALTWMVFYALQSSSVSTDPVTMQVYAWAENVRLMGPSVGLALQSRDEYGDGPISKPASTVARVARMLTKVPVIGPFATATEMGASAIGKIAGLFGFTNVPVIDNVMPLRPVASAPLATTEIGYNYEKLTVDVKNELSIDSGVLGLPSTDELAIQHIVGHESYLTTASWYGATSVGATLFWSNPCPGLYYAGNADLGNGNSSLYMTPLAWGSAPFNNWRGDIIYRFKFVCTRFHRGRVQILFDPAGDTANNLFGATAPSNAVFNIIVDLTVDTDIEVRIPYQQALGWLSTESFVKQNSTWNFPWNSATSSSGVTLPSGFPYNPLYHNGTIQMEVLTELTGPETNPEIGVMVFVRAADNFELANPTSYNIANPYTPVSYLAPQSKSEPDTLIIGGAVHSHDPGSNRVNFGESIISFRQLIRRMNLTEIRYLTTTSTSSSYQLSWFAQSRFPKQYGYDADGWDTAASITGGSSSKFNFVCPSVLSWLMPAFVGARGSTNWQINVMVGNANPIWMFAQRDVEASNTSQAVSSFFVPSSHDSSYAPWWFTQEMPYTNEGVVMTIYPTQPSLNVQAPNYTNYRMQSTYPLYVNNWGSAGFGRTSDYWSTSILTPNNGSDNSIISFFNGAGTDFNLSFFLNVPFAYIYASVPNSG